MFQTAVLTTLFAYPDPPKLQQEAKQKQQYTATITCPKHNYRYEASRTTIEAKVVVLMMLLVYPKAPKPQQQAE
jgi:hypothetical protein